ncbi:DNA-binding transcriptional activator of the SARP family [Lentzea fradiae]|uniref:DNA-binding transcriptional activator of the SARP family n=1 Tax=Lentzea fradiae TaxID=200378 RepID=A0A1G7VJM5_9PSEU|nr:BTAD domain-containing putative transcriptional regulator [Lentzea fradiae]SDG59887.1 DNA-binding transcriptional activator of the SARP family [Lentzea fradiae]
MQFSLLGPLEVVADGRPIAVGGVQQRLALSMLLLHHNSVVPTRQMLQALWPDEVPASARKMLHNAVSALRRLLEMGEPGGERPQLLTRAPGYLLQVRPESIDVVRFQRWAAQGHQALAAGEWEAASVRLREALDLWHGPLLPDLAEQGFDWPEATALRNARLNALEDRIEADFQLGRFMELTGELEALAEQEPLREGLCAKLMRLLYRRGRQADALAVYRRTREALVDRLGLDPSPELQELELAILNHDTSLLAAPAVGGTAKVSPATRAAAEPVAVDEMRWTTALLVSARPALGRTPTGQDFALLRERLRTTVSEEAGSRWTYAVVDECALAGSEQDVPLWLVTSELDGVDSAASSRAVRLARSINARFSPVSGLERPDGGWLPFEVRVAVVAGEVHLRRENRGGSRPWISADLAARCRQLLADPAAGPIEVCTTTTEALRTPEGPEPPPFLCRDHELRALDRSLRAARELRQPHLLTVFGEDGAGRSRLLREWARGLRDVTLLSAASSRGSDPVSGLAALVRAAAGIHADEPTHVVAARLTELISRLVDSHRAPWMLAHVDGLLGLDDTPVPVTAESFDALTQFFEALARVKPLVLLVDDLHVADDLVPGFLDHLLRYSGGVPLLVVASARPDLLTRFPFWGSGMVRGGSLCLAPLPDDVIATLLWQSYRSTLETRTGGTPQHCPEHLLSFAAELGGNPLFAIEYGRMLATPPDAIPARPGLTRIPYAVRSRLECLLDTLPAEARAVLYDASLVDGDFTERAVAVLATDARSRQAGRWLRVLVQRGILRATGASGGYRFADPRMRAVTRGRVPDEVRSRKGDLLKGMPRVLDAAHR